MASMTPRSRLTIVHPPIDKLQRLPEAADLPPEILTDPRWRNRFLCWAFATRDGSEKVTKLPLRARDGGWASSTKPWTWHSFERARAMVEVSRDCFAVYEDGRNSSITGGWVHGVGVVLGEGLVGVDLDHCRDLKTGELEPLAAAIVKMLPIYWEVSPSGTGLHGLFEGQLPNGVGRKHGQVEIYAGGRYFTLSGQRFQGTPRAIIRLDPKVLQDFLHRRFPEQLIHVKPRPSAARTPVVINGEGSTSPSLNPTDEEFLERIRRSRQGRKFASLWAGSTAGYTSKSEADLALTAILAWWTRGDLDWTDRLFRSSGLMRPKWDEARGAQTYGQMTLARAAPSPSACRIGDDVYTSPIRHAHISPPVETPTSKGTPPIRGRLAEAMLRAIPKDKLQACSVLYWTGPIGTWRRRGRRTGCRRPECRLCGVWLREEYFTHLSPVLEAVEVLHHTVVSDQEWKLKGEAFEERLRRANRKAQEGNPEAHQVPDCFRVFHTVRGTEILSTIPFNLEQPLEVFRGQRADLLLQVLGNLRAKSDKKEKLSHGSREWRAPSLRSKKLPEGFEFLGISSQHSSESAEMIARASGAEAGVSEPDVDVLGGTFHRVVDYDVSKCSDPSGIDDRIRARIGIHKSQRSRVQGSSSTKLKRRVAEGN